MIKVKEGDIRRLGLLFEKYNLQLYRFFYRMTRNKESSEDLVQNVFYRIMKYRKQFKGNGKFVVWMYSIARNELSDFYRIKKKITYDEFAVEDNIVNHSKDFLENKIDEENLHQLNHALDRMNEDKKQLIVLHEFQALRFREIGEILGISEVNARVKYFRALQELKENFKIIESIPA
ncbi:RNA polymerase sigma factor [Bacteroidota bacterium]